MFAQLSIYSQAIHNFGKRSYFQSFIDAILNTTCRLMILDQQEFYFGHKRKYKYKYQVAVTSDDLVSGLMELFIVRKEDWAMVEQLSLAEKLQAVNRGQQSAHTLYFYRDLTYSTI